jgi:hypothetical protein
MHHSPPYKSLIFFFYIYIEDRFDFLFYFIFLILNLLNIRLYNCFNLILMKLSRSHDLGHAFGRLTRVDSTYFFYN